MPRLTGTAAGAKPGAAPRGAAPGFEGRTILVLGLGNVLNRDEGIGVRLLEVLRGRMHERDRFGFADGGVMGLELLPLVEGCDSLLVLDAVDAGAQAGAVVELRDEEVRRFASQTLSVHEMTFHDVLALAEIRGRMPDELRVVGVQPGDTSLGTELSPAVAFAVEGAVAAATRVLVQWGVSA